LHLLNGAWQALVTDKHICADRQGLVSFLDVLQWRVDDTVTDSEFCALYNSWIEHGTRMVPRSTASVSFQNFKEIVRDRGYKEYDLDLIVALLANESNRQFILGTAQQPACKPSWLAAAEHLFFSMDLPGNSVLTFDELLLFQLAGSQALPQLTNIFTDSTQRGVFEFIQHVRSISTTAQSKKMRANYNGGVSLESFKRFLLTHMISESGIHKIEGEINKIRSLLFRHKSLRYLTSPNGSGSINSDIPEIRPWEHAVQMATNQSNETSALKTFLLADGPGIVENFVLKHTSESVVDSLQPPQLPGREEVTVELWHHYAQSMELPSCPSAEHLMSQPEFEVIFLVLSQWEESNRLIRNTVHDNEHESYSYIHMPSSSNIGERSPAGLQQGGSSVHSKGLHCDQKSLQNVFLRQVSFDEFCSPFLSSPWNKHQLRDSLGHATWEQPLKCSHSDDGGLPDTIDELDTGDRKRATDLRAVLRKMKTPSKLGEGPTDEQGWFQNFASLVS